MRKAAWHCGLTSSGSPSVPAGDGSGEDGESLIPDRRTSAPRRPARRAARRVLFDDEMPAAELLPTRGANAPVMSAEKSAAPGAPVRNRYVEAGFRVLHRRDITGRASASMRRRVDALASRL